MAEDSVVKSKNGPKIELDFSPDAWKVKERKHFKYLVILPTIFSVIALCSGLWLLMLCIIPAIKYAKKANHYRDKGDHINAKKYSRISLFCTSFALNLFIIALVLLGVAAGYTINFIVDHTATNFRLTAGH